MEHINNNMMQLLVNGMHGFVFWKSIDLRYLGCNPSFLKFLGFENKEQLIGKKDDALASSSHQEYLSRFDELVIQTEQSQYAIEEQFSQTDGSIIKLITDKHPLYDDNNNLMGILCLTSIEEDKHSTIQVYLENIITSVPYYIFWKNINLVYLGCNSKFSNLVNKMPEEVIGKTDYELGWTHSEAELFSEGDRQVLAGHSKINVEEAVLQPDGSTWIMLVNKVPVFDKNDQCIGVLGVSIDITERKKMEQDLILAKEKAEAASRVKTEFIANMSHDIRTPLTGIIGMAEVLKNNLTNITNKQQATWVSESGEQLLKLLNSVLDTVQADSVTEHDIQEEWFTLKDFFNNLLQLERPAALLKHLSLDLHLDEMLPEKIYTDSHKLHRILLNLIGNAIKFTSKGSVSLNITMHTVQNDTATLLCEVRDTGGGIDAAHLDKIFERFFRITPSYKGTHSGHGVGLHIVKQYTDLLKGTITCKSIPGNGSSFILELPVIFSKIPSEETIQPTSFIVEKVEYIEGNLLLIEDNVIALRVLELLAQKLGVHYVTATNGQEALKIAQQQHFDLIITDIGLPGMSGIELTKALRIFELEQKGSSTPIVGLTAHVTEEIRQQCINAGMQQVFAKPITEDKLLQAISYTQSLSVKHESTESIASKGLGDDLPDTVDELFKLESYSILNNTMGLENSGSISLLDELITTLTNTELPSETQKLVKAYAQKNWKGIEDCAHHLKSSALYCGAHRLKMACQYLERSQKAGLNAHQEKLYQQLMDVIAQTKAFLEQYVKLMHM